MSVITADVIRSLAKIGGEHGVASCYLDVDGSRHIRPVDYEREFDSMVRRVRNGGATNGAADDLARIEARVKEGFDRSHVKGVALFSSVAADVWEVVELPVRVRSQLVVDGPAAVDQLESVLQQIGTIGVLAADKTHARVFVFHLDQLLDRRELTDDLGRDYDTTGEHDRGGVSEHREELAHRHLRRAAELLWAAHQDHDLDHVLLAAHDHQQGELLDDLHPYLRERLHGTLDLEPSAPDAAVRDAVLRAASDIEDARAAAVVDDLRAAVGAGNRAVAGLDGVLDAFAEQRIDRLVVSSGYSVEGWRCPGCRRMATVGRTCTCGDEMEHLDDVVSRLVDEALVGSSTVDVMVNADLDVMGRIGAHLRY